MRMRKFESIEDAKIVAEKVLDSIRDRLNKIIRSRVEKEELFQDEHYKGVGRYSHEWVKAEIMRLAETWGFGAWPEYTRGGRRIDVVWYADCNSEWVPIVAWEIDRNRPAEHSHKKLIDFSAPIGVQIFLDDRKLKLIARRDFGAIFVYSPEKHKTGLPQRRKTAKTGEKVGTNTSGFAPPRCSAPSPSVRRRHAYQII